MFGLRRTPSISANDVQSQDLRVLDVREDDEWRAGHIARSLHVPVARVPRRLDELRKSDRPVVVVCRSGRRSGQVAKYLTKQGVDAKNLRGGLQAWQRAGLPLTTKKGKPGRVL